MNAFAELLPPHTPPAAAYQVNRTGTNRRINMGQLGNATRISPPKLSQRFLDKVLGIKGMMNLLAGVQQETADILADPLPPSQTSFTIRIFIAHV
jgi:hypothetical protein